MSSRRLLLLAGCLIGLPMVASAAPPTDREHTQGTEPQSAGYDNATFINANYILMFVTNHGNFGRDLSDLFGYDAGTFYPYPGPENHAQFVNDPDKKYPLYAAGLWIGGKVSNQIRVAVAEYADEFGPGPMSGGTFMADGPGFKVYKLHSDSLAGNPNDDYLNWPIDQGAPFNVTPLGDTVPPMRGRQMLWTVYNDANMAVHDNDAGSTQPLGIEVQQTVWAGLSSNPIDTNWISETISADHVGSGVGDVTVTVADPAALTGDQYRVEFYPQPDSGYFWRLVDVTTAQTLLSDQANFAGESVIVHGLLIRVSQPESIAIEAIVEVANADGLLDPPDNVMYSLNSTRDWYVDADQTGAFERLNWRGLLTDEDWEIRFDDSSSVYDWNTDLLFTEKAPFSIWNVGVGTFDDPSDDIRRQFAILDDDISGSWSYGDRIYVIEQPYIEPLSPQAQYVFPDNFQIGRVVIRDYSFLTSSPAPGTIIRFVSVQKPPLTTADTFTFAAPHYTVFPGLGGENAAVYLQYKLYNRGANTIDSFYFALWTDPDLGDAADDLVACDTLHDRFFCYNGDADDSYYGCSCPAIGFRLLCGPLVPSSPGDSAFFDGRWIPGYTNLPMTAFAKYINGTDPNDFNETYNYMKGLSPDGWPYPNGTSFMCPGDPVTGSGDLDFNPSDRRMMASCGPITFQPGDSQYVLIKMAVGQSGDRLQSIQALRTILGTRDDIPTGVADEDPTIPLRLTLLQNYPNPFNPSTTIDYSLPRRSHVRLRVYNILGQETRTLVNEEQSVGAHQIEWDGRDNTGHDAATGVYLYRIEVGDEVTSRKMLLLR